MSSLPPSDPSQPLLPFDREGFTFRDFERFCLRWIKALPDVADAQNHGRPGDGQDGIDIVAKLHAGGERSYQCRKVKHFGPADAEKAIEEDVYGADEHVVLTGCTVSPDTRKVFAEHDNWKIQDAEDICASVLVDIPIETARRIVEAGFGPAVRKAFLGGADTTLFIEPDFYFEPFTEEKRLFRHTWDLVGRADELAALQDAVTGPAKVVVLAGRGGIGKTRLLRALAEAMPQARVLFAADKDSPITAQDLDDLPLDDIIVVVDDAHQRAASDLAPLLRLGVRRAQPLTAVLATRPHAENRLRSASIAAGHAAADVISLPALPDLESLAVLELARQALGSEQQWAEELAAATADCPLVTVVGGQLLADRRIDPGLLERIDEFREEVLSRWEDELLGEVSDQHDPALVREVLKLLAAAAPVNVEHEELLGVMAGWLEISVPTLRDVISALQAAGLVIARGRLRRIVPDVLADHILHRACIDQQGAPNGFADELLMKLAPVAFEQLLGNLAELDWRVAQTAGAAALLDAVWGTMTESFRAGPPDLRISLLQTIRPVAAYQPRPALGICRLAINEPPGAAEPAAWWASTDATVREALPSVLAGVALHQEFAADVFELLWTLGRNQRDPNPGPEHPIRTLRELGGWTRGHPDLLIVFVTRLLGEDAAEDDAWHPLDLLEEVVKREGHSLVPAGVSYWIVPWFLSASAAAETRGEAFALIESGLTADATSAFRAANLLSLAMDPLRGIDGGRPSEETRAQWQDEQLSLLGLIERAWERCEPVVRARLMHDLRWHAEHDAFDGAMEKAAEIIAAEALIDVALLEAMAWPLEFVDLSGDHNRPSPALLELGAAAAELTDELPGKLNDLMACLDAAAEHDASPDALLQVLAAEHTDVALSVARWSLAHTNEPLARSTPGLMGLLFSADPEGAAGILAELDGSDPVHRRVLASRLSADGLDLDRLTDALQDEDESVRTTALYHLTRAQPTSELIDLALELQAGSRNEERILAHYLGRRTTSMTEAQLQKAGERVIEQPKLDWAWAQVVIGIGARDAALALEVLLGRVQRADESGYDAIPYERFDQDPLAGADEQAYADALRRVRTSTSHEKSAVRDEAAVLFWHLARDVDLQLAVVLEWLHSDDDAEVRTGCRLLSRMDYGTGRRRDEPEPWQLLLNRPWFAVMVLQGRPLDEKTTEHLTRALISAIEGFSTGRTIGEASARATRTVEVAGPMVKVLPAGPAQALYATLNKRAEEEMANDSLDDEELEDR